MEDLKREKSSVPFLLARNSLYNLVTQLFLMFLGVWAIPIIVRGIAEERFGLLSLVWAFLGYFGLLDFGISRAATKFVADSLARENHEEVRRVISTSLGLMTGIGFVCSVCLWAATSLLVSSVFSVDPQLEPEAMESLHLTAVALPFVLVAGVVRGVQMAYQRFDIVNLLQLGLGVAQWVGSAILVYLGYGLTAIIGLLVTARIILALVSLALLWKIVGGGIALRTAWDASLVRSVFAFGGWVAVSQILAPLFLYLDRIVIGAMLTLTAVAYYTVPQEIVSRLLVFPLSLTLVLFPMLSSGNLASESHREHSGLYKRSVKHLFSLVFPLALLAIALAPEFLQWWVGEEFASHSEVVFQVLSAGFFFNALAQLPATALQAAGLPNVTAKIHLLEVVPTIIVMVACIFLWGLIGAAISWSLRAFGDCILLFIAARRKIPNVARNSMAFLTQFKVVLPVILLVLLVVVAMVVGVGGVKIGLLSFAGVLYLVSLWFVVFDDLDRTFFLQLRTRASRKAMVE